MGTQPRRTPQPQLSSKGASRQPGDPQASRGHFWASEPIPVASSHLPRRAGPPRWGDHGQGEMLSCSLVSSSRSVPGQSRSARGAAPGFLFMGLYSSPAGFQWCPAIKVACFSVLAARKPQLA